MYCMCLHDGVHCMMLSHQKSSSVRQLIQCHCLAWDDHSVPDDYDSVFTLISEMHSHTKYSDNPVLVHCRYTAVETCTLVLHCLGLIS